MRSCHCMSAVVFSANATRLVCTGSCVIEPPEIATSGSPVERLEVRRDEARCAARVSASRNTTRRRVRRRPRRCAPPRVHARLLDDRTGRSRSVASPPSRLPLSTTMISSAVCRRQLLRDERPTSRGNVAPASRTGMTTDTVRDAALRRGMRYAWSRERLARTDHEAVRVEGGNAAEQPLHGRVFRARRRARRPALRRASAAPRARVRDRAVRVRSRRPSLSAHSICFAPTTRECDPRPIRAVAARRTAQWNAWSSTRGPCGRDAEQ